MSVALQKLVTGPAVVVDDKIGEPAGALRSILDQLHDAGLPVVLLTALPSVESLVHWHQFGLIVLDWEMSFSEGDDVDIPAGVAVPSTLAGESHANVRNLIRALMAETVAPVFILSDASVDKIWAELAQELGDIQELLSRRLEVYSKSEVQVDLMEKLTSWISSKPALGALKAWNRAYVAAETAMFRDFDEASGDWVGAVYSAALADGAPPEVELREILSRNVINRIGHVDFPTFEPVPGAILGGADLRRVLNQGAVIPARSLGLQGFVTGDLFVPKNANIPYKIIFVIVTPDCELLRRAEFRLTYLTAELGDPGKKASKGRVDRVRKGAEGEVWSCLLTPEGDEYKIKLGGWNVAMAVPIDDVLWAGYRRIGRLMEPYLSHLQQNFALNVTRKGLPRVPDNFFDG